MTAVSVMAGEGRPGAAGGVRPPATANPGHPEAAVSISVGPVRHLRAHPLPGATSGGPRTAALLFLLWSGEASRYFREGPHPAIAFRLLMTRSALRLPPKRGAPASSS